MGIGPLPPTARVDTAGPAMHISPHDALHANVSAHFATGATRPIAARLDALRRLHAAIGAAEADLTAALHDDLGKPAFEAYTSELLHVRQEITHVVANVQQWAAPRRVRTNWFHWPARAAVAMEPLGAVLVLSPWNYPVQLALVPLVSAVAAGNCVLLKPSEHAPATAAALERLVAAVFDPGHVRVVAGDAAVAQQLTALPWDHVFFTGSTQVGRAVALAAAANLIPTTLELGGCNPCVVEPTADVALTAKRIVWGKFLNAGQTCLAPNHLLVHETIYDPLLTALRQALTAAFGPDGTGVQRLVNRRHFDRVAAYLTPGRVAHGGGTNPAALRIAPTLLVDVPDQAPSLTEEIFGPILPLVPWRDEAALLGRLAAAPPPLVITVHGRDAGFAARVRDATRSGAFVRNDHLVQATVAELPFGGVGPSGMGRSHGRAGFEAFSNPRAQFRQSPRLELPLRYPPYEGKLAWVKRLMG